MAGGKLPGPNGLWCEAEVIDTGTLALCTTPAPGTVASSIATWSSSEKLAAAIRCAANKIPGDAGDKLMSLLAPETIAVIAIVLGGWAASHAFGIGEVVDVLLIAGGLIFIGMEAIDAADHIGSFVSRSLQAKSEADLDAAGGHLAKAITIVGIDAVLILLTRGAVKTYKGRYRPTVKGDPNLPPGYGETDAFGNVRYSTSGSAADQALVRYHEMVHSFLSPKLQPLRQLRAKIGMTAYERSSLLRYIEEALAESYAQLRVNGFKGLPVGIKFPIANGYVTLTAVLVEGAIGTVTVGGITYYVYLEASDK